MQEWGLGLADSQEPAFEVSLPLFSECRLRVSYSIARPAVLPVVIINFKLIHFDY